MDNPQALSVAVFFHEGYVGVAPTVMTLIQAIAKANHPVTVFATQNPYPTAQITSPAIRIRYLISGFFSPGISFFFKATRKVGLKSLALTCDFLLYWVQCCLFLLPTRHRAHEVNIGIDTYGSIIALFKSKLFNQKMVYLSLELNAPTRYRNIAGFLSKLEKAALNSSEFILIQDEDRYKTLASYHELREKSVIYLPNVLLSEAKTELTTEGNFFREKFELSDDRWPCLILHAGAIADEFLSTEVAEAFAHIDRPYALIFHERQQRSESERYITSLKQINARNMFLSLEPVDLADLHRIYTSADIGLALYSGNIDANYSQIAKASGKLAAYLKYGKPVIVNHIPSLASLVSQYGIGQVVDNPKDAEEMDAAIAAILADYEGYSHRARECYRREFDVSEKVKAIVQRLALLARQHSH